MNNHEIKELNDPISDYKKDPIRIYVWQDQVYSNSMNGITFQK